VRLCSMEIWNDVLRMNNDVTEESSFYRFLER
jgi:hypothetical protein